MTSILMKNGAVWTKIKLKTKTKYDLKTNKDENSKRYNKRILQFYRR